ncbi:transcriptional regulator [Metapseudomonas resinovorans]|uniref:LysR substrate-binding domain-containing protein n=1 Tax=Metapseudomonas resinovorans TaxID=53412 RepID=UPI0009868E0C|nr:LysR substrate-binding domain-containing protein [Pseudomonas resinovorans]GLZ89136.1 transcriptional regulator [Pseudomonas resinovorans]
MALPSLNSLRVFESVARLGSITAAAGELNVTAGAVSQQVKVLQGHLGIELLVRNGRHLALTDKGTMLQRRVSRAISEIQEAIHVLQDDGPTALEPVRLTLSLPPLHTIGWLATPLFDFMESNERADLTLITANAIDEVDWTVADCAVIHGTPPWEGFFWKHLRETHLTPVCSPRLSKGSEAIRSVVDLRKHRLLHEDGGNQWRQWLAAVGGTNPGGFDIHFEDFEMVLQAARDGLGVALTDESSSRQDLEEGRLIQPLKLAVPAAKSFYGLCSAAKRGQPGVDYLLDWLEFIAYERF